MLLQPFTNSSFGLASFNALQGSRVIQILIDGEIRIERLALEDNAHGCQCLQRIRAEIVTHHRNGTLVRCVQAGDD